MAQANKVCAICKETGHSKFYCKKKPIKPIKAKAIQSKAKAINKPKKKRTESASTKAKKAAWDSFSIYIRTRDCLRFTGDPTEGMCVTCKQEFPFKKLQAGHFISSRRNAVLFDERIVYTQCSACNINPPYGLGGNYVEYFVFMEQEWGREKIDEFRSLKFESKPYKLHDYIAIKEMYDQKTAELLA